MFKQLLTSVLIVTRRITDLNYPHLSSAVINKCKALYFCVDMCFFIYLCVVCMCVLAGKGRPRMGGACQGQKHRFLYHRSTHPHPATPKHTALPSSLSSISCSSTHLSPWQEEEGGRDRAMEGEEGGARRTINCKAEWRGRKTERWRERETERKTKVERE